MSPVDGPGKRMRPTDKYNFRIKFELQYRHLDTFITLEICPWKWRPHFKSSQFLLPPPRMRQGNVSILCAFDCLDIITLFWYGGTSCPCLRQVQVPRSLVQHQQQQNQRVLVISICFFFI